MKSLSINKNRFFRLGRRVNSFAMYCSPFPYKKNGIYHFSAELNNSIFRKRNFRQSVVSLL